MPVFAYLAIDFRNQDEGDAPQTSGTATMSASLPVQEPSFIGNAQQTRINRGARFYGIGVGSACECLRRPLKA
jgi:hypothetical protein